MDCLTSPLQLFVLEHLGQLLTSLTTTTVSMGPTPLMQATTLMRKMTVWRSTAGLFMIGRATPVSGEVTPST